MKLEDLPGELWFLILSYLTPLEAFYAFNNITNTRIQSILLDMYLIERKEDYSSSILNISLVNLPLYMYNFAVSNVISFYSNIIYSLTLSNERTPGQIKNFLEKYSFKYDFTYLKSLCLIEPTSNEFNIIINDLPTIKKLHIQSKDMHLFDINTIQKIFYLKSTITHCYLSQFRNDFILNSSYSFMKILLINSCDYQCFINILNHFSLLEKLSIHTLSMSHNIILSSINLMNNSILIQYLKIRVFSIPFNYLYILFPYFENLHRFSLSVFCNEGFDYVNSNKWQMIISNYWPILENFQIYSELWHLTPIDFEEIYPQLLSFQNDSFWIRRQIEFRTDFYQDKNSLHCIFYSNPYADKKFSNQWGNSIDIILPSINHKIENPYRYVNHLLLTIYNNKQMRNDLDKSSKYFPSIETLSIRFEQSISSTLLGLYVNKFINLNYIKHLALNDKCHTIATLYELVIRLPNMIKLTITSNHRILIKQIFQKRNEYLLVLLRQRVRHLNLLYDGVISYETIELIRLNFSSLKSLTACLPHFEDFRDTIPALIRQIKSLQYLHIGLECDNDKKNFSTQDMYDWFRRHNIFQELQLYIDTYTNSIHIWL